MEKLALNMSQDFDDGVWIDTNNKHIKETPFAGTAAKFKIRPISGPIMSKAVRENTTIKKGAEIVDMISANSDLFKRCVVDWKNIVDHEGNDIPCDPKTKGAIASRFTDLASAVVSAAVSAYELGKEVQETETKNS